MPISHVTFSSCQARNVWVPRKRDPQNCCLIPRYFMYLLCTSVIFQNRNWTVESILLKAAGHVRLKYSTKGMAGKKGGAGLLIRVSSAMKCWLFYFCPQYENGINRHRQISVPHQYTDALDILWIFWFSCMKGKEMHAR